MRMAMSRPMPKVEPLTLTTTSPFTRETTLTLAPSTKPISERCWRSVAVPRTLRTRIVSPSLTIARGSWAPLPMVVASTRAPARLAGLLPVITASASMVDIATPFSALYGPSGWQRPPCWPCKLYEANS